IQMFSDVVMGIDKNKFEKILDEVKEKKGVKHDVELTAEDLKEVVKRFKELYKQEMGVEFPQELTSASWNPAETYAVLKDSEGNLVLIGSVPAA
ncbi:MAG: hypothetical protein LOD91_11765, partial [Limnochordales bacterium]